MPKLQVQKSIEKIWLKYKCLITKKEEGKGVRDPDVLVGNHAKGSSKALSFRGKESSSSRSLYYLLAFSSWKPRTVKMHT